MLSIAEFKAIWPVASKDGSRDWMGDVFRLVFFIQTFLPAFRYAAVADNHGQLVMWRGKRPPELRQDRTVEAVSQMDCKDTILSEKRSTSFLLGKSSGRRKWI